MIEHADGSVTLSEREFGSLALHCEVPRTKLKELLRDTGDNVSQEDLQRLTRDLATLILHRKDGEAH